MNHRAHVELTFAFLRDCGFTAGSDAVYDYLNALDAAQHGGRFHATLSTLWPRLIAAHMRQAESGFDAFIAREPDLADKTLPLRFYSNERLFSEAACRRFLEPDLRDLPRIAIGSHGPHDADSPGSTRNRDPHQ